MANRYWNPAGSPADWNESSSWAATDGGDTGEDIPTNADDVYFTSTNTNDCVVDAPNGTTKNLTMTGYSGTITIDNSIYCYGNIVLEGDATYTGSSSSIGHEDEGTHTLFSDASTGVDFYVDAGTVRLADDSKCAFDVQDGATLDTAGYNINNRDVTFSWGDGGWVAIYGAGDILLNNATVITNMWYVEATSNVECGSSTIKIYSLDAGGYAGGIVGGDQTYCNVELLWGDAVAANAQILGDNTFTRLTLGLPQAANQNFIFKNGSVQTINGLTATGTAAHPIVISSDGTGTISKSAGIISCDYLTLSNITVEGGATFYIGTNTTDSGGNTGWTAGDAPVPPQVGNSNSSSISTSLGF